MSLRYPENLGFAGISEEGWQEYIKEQLNLRLERFKEKQHKINDLNYEKELIEDDIIDIIKVNLHYSQCTVFQGLQDKVFNDAWTYFWHKNDNEWSEENKIKLKTSFEYVTETLKEKFFKNYDVELTEVIQFWYGVAYDFIYKYKNQFIQIKVPCYSMVNRENYAYLLSGYEVSYKENDHCWGHIASGIDYKDIIEKLHKWIDENCK